MHIRATSRRLRLAAATAAGLLALVGTACEPTPPVKPATPTPTTTTTIPALPAPTVGKANCPAGGTVTVATSILPKVKSLLAAAKADGLSLCGGGYRDSAGQIAVRKANCGTTYYDIYQKPSSQCSPPTAIPGTSMHEKGLAIDFTKCDTHATACYKWLAKNASTYGLQNLPSESWHWSTNGR